MYNSANTILIEKIKELMSNHVFIKTGNGLSISCEESGDGSKIKSLRDMFQLISNLEPEEGSEKKFPAVFVNDEVKCLIINGKEWVDHFCKIFPQATAPLNQRSILHLTDNSLSADEVLARYTEGKYTQVFIDSAECPPEDLVEYAKEVYRVIANVNLQAPVVVGPLAEENPLAEKLAREAVRSSAHPYKEYCDAYEAQTKHAQAEMARRAEWLSLARDR